jgi:hypothetical protein
MTDEPNPTRQMLDEIASNLAGQRIDGGCDSCNAYQEMTKDPKNPGIYHIVIFHDDWCPEHPAG